MVNIALSNTCSSPSILKKNTHRLICALYIKDREAGPYIASNRRLILSEVCCRPNMKDINKTTKLKNNLKHSYFYIYLSIINYLIYNKKCPNKKDN